jgi:hypothetical protein
LYLSPGGEDIDFAADNVFNPGSIQFADQLTGRGDYDIVVFVVLQRTR